MATKLYCDPLRPVCEVQVDASLDAEGVCKLSPPDEVIVQVGHPVKMRWTLDDAHGVRFKFKRGPGNHNGISILDDPSHPQFSDETDSDDKQASKKNAATMAGKFPYKIVAQVFSTGAHPPWVDCPFDPVIINKE